MEPDSLMTSIGSIVIGLLAVVGALQYFAKWTETDKDNQVLAKIHSFLLKIKGMFFANQKVETTGAGGKKIQPRDKA